SYQRGRRNVHGGAHGAPRRIQDDGRLPPFLRRHNPEGSRPGREAGPEPGLRDRDRRYRAFRGHAPADRLRDGGPLGADDTSSPLPQCLPFRRGGGWRGLTGQRGPSGVPRGLGLPAGGRGGGPAGDPSEARLEAERFWKAAAGLPTPRRRRAVELSPRASQSWALAELLCHKSEQAAVESPQEALELAENGRKRRRSCPAVKRLNHPAERAIRRGRRSIRSAERLIRSARQSIYSAE